MTERLWHLLSIRPFADREGLPLGRLGLEADTIIEGGGEFLPHAIEFDEVFNEIVDTTAAVFENVLRRQLGATVLHALYQEFIGLVGGRLDTTALACFIHERTRT